MANIDEDKEKDTTGFLNWYKNNYGSDYDGSSGIDKLENMSTKDYMLGRNMLNNYRTQQSLNSQQENANNNLILQRDNAQQQASISFDKLLKYIGKEQQINGLQAGAGTSNAIAANNNYQKSLGDINQNYKTSKNELDNYYQSQKDTANQNAYNNESELLNYYLTKEESDKDNLQNLWFEQAQLNLDNKASQFNVNNEGKYSEKDYNSLLNDLENYRDKIGEEQYELLKDYIIKNYGTNIENETERINNDMILNGVEPITYNGNNYYIINSIDINKVLSENKKFKELIRSKFYTDDIFDSRIENGTTLEDGNSSVTYFNGKWYLSQKK